MSEVDVFGAEKCIEKMDDADPELGFGDQSICNYVRGQITTRRIEFSYTKFLTPSCMTVVALGRLHQNFEK